MTVLLDYIIMMNALLEYVDLFTIQVAEKWSRGLRPCHYVKLV